MRLVPPGGLVEHGEKLLHHGGQFLDNLLPVMLDSHSCHLKIIKIRIKFKLKKLSEMLTQMSTCGWMRDIWSEENDGFIEHLGPDLEADIG